MVQAFAVCLNFLITKNEIKLNKKKISIPYLDLNQRDSVSQSEAAYRALDPTQLGGKASSLGPSDQRKGRRLCKVIFQLANRFGSNH